jgi:hypothetical protein
MRRHRWFSGLIAIVLLVGQTVALASDCQRPMPVPASHDPSTVSSEVTAEVIGGCVDHADPVAGPEHPLLCKAHCQADQQSVNSSGAGAVDLPSALLLGPVRWHLPDRADSAQVGAPAPRTQPVGPPAGFPPLYLSLLVLRN